MSFDAKTFFATIRDSLFDRSLSQRQVDGTNALLAAWQASAYTDERWLAYILATAYHETGRAMYPVPEGGLGKGHPYGQPGRDGGQIAYGRGYVQLTWDYNYEKADKALGLGGALVAQYNLALRPDIAARIIIEGMANAWFTAFRLSDYLNDHLADYLHARKIVNGMDRADTIAGYAVHFQDAITAAARKGADTSVVATSVAPAATTTPPVPPTASPSPAPVPKAPPATTESTDMNPISGMLVAARTFQTVLPVIMKTGSAIVTNLPDIEKQAATLVTGLEKAYADAKSLDITSAEADLGAAWKAGMQVFVDVGISRELVTQVTTSAATDLPSLSGLESVIGIAGTIAKGLGLPLAAAA